MTLTTSRKPLMLIKRKTGDSNAKRKHFVNLDDVHQEWVLQPHLESLPWDSRDELAFPVQVPSSYWAFVEDQVQPHKKQKLDCLSGKTLHTSNENLTKKQMLVENIPPEATMSDLQDHVSSFGEIYSLVVLWTKSTNITQQLNTLTATVFFEKHSNLSELGCFDWKEFGEGVAAYLIRRSSLTWLRLTNLPHRTKMKMLKKCLSNHVPISEVVKHSQVCRTAILTFEERSSVQNLLEAQHELKKLQGNRLIFTANHDHVRMISVSPVQVNSMFLPENVTALKWHRDTGIFYHDTITLTHNKINIGGSNKPSSVNGENIIDGDCQGNREYLDGRVTQWEYGEAISPNTICIVGLPADVKRKRLKKLLASAVCGVVVSVTHHLDRSPAHAYVTFKDKEAVESALKTQCQLTEEAPRLLHFATSKIQSPAYLTELLFQAGNNITEDSSSAGHDINMFKFSLSRHIAADDATSSVAPRNHDPFELPPNTVLVVGGLNDCKKYDVKQVSNRHGKVLHVELLKSAWPVHGYVSYASSTGAQKAVKKQKQLNDHRMTLTVATERKLTLKQIVELTKQHPKLLLEGTASTKPLFYRRERDVPSWATFYFTS